MKDDAEYIDLTQFGKLLFSGGNERIDVEPVHTEPPTFSLTGVLLTGVLLEEPDLNRLLNRLTPENS